jgi:hypothetical protein
MGLGRVKTASKEVGSEKPGAESVSGRITRKQRQSMGRSRGGLTSKIQALVDSNGLPVRLALSPGEAHDIRFALKPLSPRVNAAC